MAINFRKGQSREDPEINLIPFIDVLLVILIFLLVTTTYSRFTALQITLPTADAEKAMEQPFEIHIGVDHHGRYTVNNAQVPARDAAALSEEMKSALNGGSSKNNSKNSGEIQNEPVVIINADATAAHQSVVNVLEAARLAGFDKVTFAAQTSGK